MEGRGPGWQRECTPVIFGGLGGDAQALTKAVYEIVVRPQAKEEAGGRARGIGFAGKKLGLNLTGEPGNDGVFANARQHRRGERSLEKFVRQREA